MSTYLRIMSAALAVIVMFCGQASICLSSGADTSPAAAAPVLSAEQLDKLLAPIALYPDPLLAQILPAATTPSDIVLAARYVAAKKDPNKIDQQPWEESVKALARYPDVLKMMDEKLDWTTELGEAFVAQPKDIFDSVQRLRARAAAAGNLKDSPQQVIVKEKEVIKIMPADPQVIYVPVYQPDVVYVASPTPVVAPLVTFGAGLALGIWIHNELDWHDNHIYYHNSGWHGGYYHGGNYRGGNNTINIDNSNNINIGNGNGNINKPNSGNGNGSVWKPQTKPAPPRYGSDNSSGLNGNKKSGPNVKPGNGNDGLGSAANQKPANRPQQQPANRPQPRPAELGSSRRGGNSPGGGSVFSRESSKPQQQGAGGRFGGAQGGNGGAASRGSGGGRGGNRGDR